MGVELEIDRAIGERLLTHLRASATEELAILIADDEGGERFVARDLCLVPADDLEVKTDFHIRLTSEARSRVLRWAHERPGVLIEAHAHRTAWPAQFSPSDQYGFEDWVPHVRWRLGGRAYLALVFADSSCDALLWTGDDATPSGICGLRLGTDDPWLPTGLSLRDVTSSGRRS